MSYYKLKTSLDTVPLGSLKSYVLSDDLKHLVVYNQYFFVLINLHSRNVVLSNECHEHMRIRYCAIDSDIFIVQYQTPNTYLLHIRSLKSAPYCHEIETSQEITCHVKADFKIEDESEVLGIFFGTANGQLKFFNYKAQNQLYDINLKVDPTVKRAKIRKILVFPESDTRLLTLIDETGFTNFYVFDQNFDCKLVNTLPGSQDKQWLIDAFRIQKSETETYLGLILKTDDDISLFTAEPQRCADASERNLFARTSLRKFSHYVKYTLLKEPVKPHMKQVMQGDVLAMIDEMAREYIDIKLYFLKTGEEVEYRYTPSEILRESVGPLFIDAAGLIMYPQSGPNSQKKVGICIVLNKAGNVLFDQIRPNEDDKFVRLEKEKYNIFKNTFDLKTEGEALIKAENLLDRRVEVLEGEEPNPYDLKLSFIEYLLKNSRHQVLVDILVKKEQREGLIYEGEDEENYIMLELERCEEAVYKVFEREKVIGFDCNNIDAEKLRAYQVFLWSTLKVFNAIIKRKEEEAISNVRALRTQTILGMEDDILTRFYLNRNQVLKEIDFCKALEFTVESGLAKTYNAYYNQILKQWLENRNKYDTIFASSRQGQDSGTQFFIDLLTEGKLKYPAPIEDVLGWVRESGTSLEKKLMLYYLIKKDLQTLMGENDFEDNSNKMSNETVSSLIKKFFAKFTMTDKEINLLSGLVRLDMLIDKVKLSRNAEGELKGIGRTEELLKVVKEACYHLSACEIENDSWKEFILDTLYQYQCYDELAIFMRTGRFNWKEPKLSQKHLTILLKLGKVLQAYHFVSGQLEINEKDQSLSKGYEDLFYDFVDQVISLGMMNELNNICLRNYEKLLLKTYFEQRNIQHGKHYVLYLLKRNQVIEAVEFLSKNKDKANIDHATLRFVVWKIQDLPELVRSKIEDKHPTLKTLCDVYKGGKEDGDMQVEERGRAAPSDNLHSGDLVNDAADKLYVSTTRRTQPMFSINEVREAMVNRENNGEKLGLMFNTERKEIAKDNINMVESQYILPDRTVNKEKSLRGQGMDEEETKVNLGAQLRVSRERFNGFGSDSRSGLLISQLRPANGETSREGGSLIKSMGLNKKKLSQLF